MKVSSLLIALLPLTLALPQPKTVLNRAVAWDPAPNTKVECDLKFDKKISFFVGPQKETVIGDACAAMMPPCANPALVGSDTFCAQTTDWPLDGAKSSTQHANVVNGTTTNKISGWSVKLSVTPPAKQDSSVPVMWTKDDCYGYFERFVSKLEPEGCVTDKGSGVGKLIDGGSTSLKGTEFELTIVKNA